MTDRTSQAQAFLNQTDWAGAEVKLLAGDASNRKYHRLTRAGTGQTAVLMDAPPDKGEDIRPFIQIATYLSGIGLSAPRIFAADEVHGFLLIEDLGDALYARVLEGDPAMENSLYTAATDTLVALHDRPPPSDLACYDAEVMADMACLAFNWYASGAGVANTSARQRFRGEIRNALAQHTQPHDVLIQRDYHAENLLWLPTRSGVARVGLLDFQDAMTGHRAYDLVSLLQDARRDVPPGIETRMIEHYISVTGADPVAFEAAYRCLGAQRNLRILGVFARLCLRDGKAGYVDLIPRVWGHLQNDLTHPALAPASETLSAALPEPTLELLRKLKEKCATTPAL